MIRKGTQAVVVNDDPTQLRLMSGLLERFGLEVEAFTHPEKALRALRRRGPVDLLVVDLHMPGLDGWKFCRLVRSEDFPGFEDVPILMVSATFSGAEVEEVSAQLGANGFLPIPYQPEVLKRYVEDLLEGRKPRYVPQALVVDDDPEVRITLGRVLEQAGYRVLLAPDGKEAGLLYRRVRPDLVILDYHLPDLTGEALLETIRRPGDPAVVLVITGDADPRLAVRVLQKGADGFVRKPLDGQILVEMAARARRERALLRVEELLEMRTQELRASEERYRTLFTTIPEAVLMVGEGGVVLQGNEVAERTFGRKGRDLVGLSLQELVRGDAIPQVLEGLQRIREMGEGAFEAPFLSGTGEVRYFEVSGRSVEFQGSRSLLLVGRDVTERRLIEEERRKLQAQIQQAQKMESLGVIAGGIAHDFNNLLVGILGNASLVLMDLEPGHPAREHLQQIELAARRAAELTEQILTYAGKGKANLEELSLPALVREMRILMEPALSKKAELRLQLAEGVPPVKADPAQIRQVLMNLILNASDALGGESGTIEVRVRTVVADRELLRRSFVGQDLPEGKYVSLEVEDTGCGMDGETLARIFDPFFTTKFTGRGLGLASTLGIVRGHSGAILVQSHPGRGTNFQILFPPAHGERRQAGGGGGPASVPGDGSPPAPTPRDPSPPGEEPSIPCGEGGDGGGGWRREVVLVVDDEAAVRRFAGCVLNRAGFSILEAGTGEEGVQRFQAHREEIAAVLLDLTMPGMDGREVLKRVRSISPEVPVILSSGYSQEAALQGLGDGPATRFLRKPYSPSALRGLVLELTGVHRPESGEAASPTARKGEAA